MLVVSNSVLSWPRRALPADAFPSLALVLYFPALYTPADQSTVDDRSGSSVNDSDADADGDKTAATNARHTDVAGMPAPDSAI